MKKLIRYLCISILCWYPNISIWALPTTTVTVGWSASPDSSVSGYKIYYSQTSATYTATGSIDVGNVLTYQLTRTTLIPGTKLFFVVTAYTPQLLESDFSNEISILIPRPPLTLQITAHSLTINSFQGANLVLSSSPDLVNWTDQTLLASADTMTMQLDPTLPQQFYRARYGLTPMTEAVVAAVKKKETMASLLPPMPPSPPTHIRIKRSRKIYEHGAQFLMSEKWR